MFLNWFFLGAPDPGQPLVAQVPWLRYLHSPGRSLSSWCRPQASTSTSDSAGPQPGTPRSADPGRPLELRQLPSASETWPLELRQQLPENQWGPAACSPGHNAQSAWPSCSAPEVACWGPGWASKSGWTPVIRLGPRSGRL